MLLGHKISDRVAAMRDLPKGIDQRSACRHPDWTGPDDLEIKIGELREITDWEKPIFVKVGATRTYYDVQLAVKAGADVIVVDGMQGGTAATQDVFIEHVGIPTLCAIPLAVQALQELDMHREVQLIVSGGIRSGADVAKALALGADAVSIGTAAADRDGRQQPRLRGRVPRRSAARPATTTTGRPAATRPGSRPRTTSSRHASTPSSAAARSRTTCASLTLETQTLARACGKSHVHNLEPEDLVALTIEAAAMARVPLAGTNWIPGRSGHGVTPAAIRIPERLDSVRPDTFRLPRSVVTDRGGGTWLISTAGGFDVPKAIRESSRARRTGGGRSSSASQGPCSSSALIGYALVALGGFAIVLFAVITAIGVFLCFCLAEMAATLARTCGRAAVVRVRDVQADRQRVSRHLGGLLVVGATGSGGSPSLRSTPSSPSLYIIDLSTSTSAASSGRSTRSSGSASPSTSSSSRHPPARHVHPLLARDPARRDVRDRARDRHDHPARPARRAPVLQAGSLDASTTSTLSLSSSPIGTESSFGSWCWAGRSSTRGRCSRWRRPPATSASAASRSGTRRSRSRPRASSASSSTRHCRSWCLPCSVSPRIAELGIDAAVVFNGYVDAIFGTSTFWNWFVSLTIIAALLLLRS